MFYCDSSLVVAVLESHTDVARDWMARHDAALSASAWVAAEVASALAQKQRMNALSAEERARAQRAWSTALAPRIMNADVASEDFRRAATLVDMGRRGLRAADALHLAIAERLGLDMATLDDDLADAARAIGMDAPDIRAQA